MNIKVMEAAQALADAIAASPEFIGMRLAEQTAEQNTALQQLVAEYVDLKAEMEDLAVQENADFEAIEKLNDRIGKVRQQIDAQPCAVVMRDGRKAFDEMMKMVNTRLQSVLAPGNEGKCTQSCAACGGKCR